MPGSKPGERRGGRKPGSRNKQHSAEELRAKAEAAEFKARIKRARAGIVTAEVAKAVMEAVPAREEYVRQVKPGQRDLTDRFARIQLAIEELEDLQQIKRERAAHPEMADVPGGKSGLVTYTYVRNGENQYCKVSRFDSALDAAIQDKLRYIAEELGQFRPDSEIVTRKDGTLGAKPPVDYSVLTIEELDELRRLALKLEAGRTVPAAGPESVGAP